MHLSIKYRKISRDQHTLVYLHTTVHVCTRRHVHECECVLHIHIHAHLFAHTCPCARILASDSIVSINVTTENPIFCVVWIYVYRSIKGHKLFQIHRINFKLTFALDWLIWALIFLYACWYLPSSRKQYVTSESKKYTGLYTTNTLSAHVVG